MTDGKRISAVVSLILCLSLICSVLGITSCTIPFDDGFGFSEETKEKSEAVTNGFAWSFNENSGVISLSFTKGQYTYNGYSKLNGKTWEFSINGSNPDQISFYDVDHGFALYRTDAFLGHRVYKVYKTNDGGQSWETFNCNNNDTFITTGVVTSLFAINESYISLVSVFDDRLYYYGLGVDSTYSGSGYINYPEEMDRSDCNIVVNLEGHEEGDICTLSVTFTDSNDYSVTTPIRIMYSKTTTD